MKTIGISPKIIAYVVSSVVAWFATRYGFDIDPELAAGLSNIVGALCGIAAPPGTVIEK